MRQQKKSRVRVLQKKLDDIKSGKWKASPEDLNKLKKALQDAKAAEKGGNLK